MLILSKDLHPGMVVWAYKAPYYDAPYKVKFQDKGMYLIVKVNYDYFLGCPVVISNSPKNSTILHKSIYPLRSDSRVNECIYKISNNDIVSRKNFSVLPETLEYFKRKMYERIVLGYAEGKEEYNDIFINDYLSTHIPSKGNIITYPSKEKKLYRYYIYDENKRNYVLIELDKIEGDYFIHNTKKIVIPKKIKFFSYYENPNIDHNKLKEMLFVHGQEKQGYDFPIGTVICTNLSKNGEKEENQDKDFIVIGSNDTDHYVMELNYQSYYVPIYKVSKTSKIKEIGMVTNEYLKNALVACLSYCTNNEHNIDSTNVKILQKALSY